jgi:hypothetical protein
LGAVCPFSTVQQVPEFLYQNFRRGLGRLVEILLQLMQFRQGLARLFKVTQPTVATDYKAKYVDL